MNSDAVVNPCSIQVRVYDDAALSARYKRVRAAFLLQDSSFHAWCSLNGVAMPNARAAMLQKWDGPRAKALVQRIMRDAKVQDSI